MKRILLLACLALTACHDDQNIVQGYAEGDFLRLGATSGGRIATLRVDKGQRVAAGQLLFTLDDGAEQARLAEAQAKTRQARASRDNLLTGKRALEIRAIAAQRDQAAADLALAEIQLRRQAVLIRSGDTAQASLDNARAAVKRDQARVAELEASLAFAHQGGRSAEIRSADAAVTAAEAAEADAAWALEQRRVTAPEAGEVQDVLFRPGEVVAADQGVISLLPPGNIKLRFYLGPERIGALKPGRRLQVACSGCPAGLSAHVSYVAPDASYAPPILYSRDNASKLVFLVEARPDGDAARFRPGQPLTLTLPPGGAP